DNAAQPLQAGPMMILETILTTGHVRKLRFAFTKFDLVTAANLSGIAGRKDHVRASLDQAIASLQRTYGKSAERSLRGVADASSFFLSDLRRQPDKLTSFARRQLGILVGSFRTH